MPEKAQGKIGKQMANPNDKSGDKVGAIIAADFVELGNTKYVVTTANNNMIDFWDSNNYAQKESINTADIQLCIKWCGDGVNKLFTGGCDKLIHAYDVT